MSGLIELPHNRAIVLRNKTCAYCGRRFDAELQSTKEHVIARRFVPRGCFKGQWNLIVLACERCNNEKAALEDDISAISMMPDLCGRFATDDARLNAEVQRKAINSRSRKTGKPVAHSHEEIKVEHNFGPMTMTFNVTAPAQVEDARSFRLAHYHWRGFFYFITYNQETGIGGFAHGDFCPIMAVRRADWGNPSMRWFMERIRDWDLRLCAIGADTFFKIHIRRHPEDKKVWAWALEWNHSIRVFGFCGDETEIDNVVSKMPDLKFEVVHEVENEWMRMRRDVPLPEPDDDLFTV
jgi:hypothetical protein